MDILLLTPQSPHPPRQGTTIRNFNLIQQLAGRHTVDLLTFLAPGDHLPPGGELYKLCNDVGAVPQPVRSVFHRARQTFTSQLPDMALRLKSAQMHRTVTEWVQRRHYDIVQAEGIEMAQYGLRAVDAFSDGGNRPRFVFDDHNCEYLLQKRNAVNDLRNPRRWLAAGYSVVQWQKLRRYEARICDRADATVAVSEADRQALIQLGAGRFITVVPNGIDLRLYPAQRVQPMSNAGVQLRYLVFTGKMDYRPNIDAVLWFAQEVLPLIRRQAPDARFQIVGMNPHARLDALRSNPSVEITGTVADTRPYIYGAAVYVIPMRVGGGTRFKALEAMACGRPIVSTSLGVEGIGVHDGRELLMGDSAEQFSAAVLDLLAAQAQGNELPMQLGVAARRFVEARYDWPTIIPGLEAVYDQLLH